MLQVLPESARLSMLAKEGSNGDGGDTALPDDCLHLISTICEKLSEHKPRRPREFVILQLLKDAAVEGMSENFLVEASALLKRAYGSYHKQLSTPRAANGARGQRYSRHSSEFFRRNATHRLRYTEGLTEQSIKAGPLQLINSVLNQQLDEPTPVTEFIREQELPSLDEYFVCSIGGCVTSDLMEDHIQRQHPDCEGLAEGGEDLQNPTEAYIATKAEQFGSSFDFDANAPEFQVLDQNDVGGMHLYTLETPVYSYVNHIMRTGDESGILEWTAFIYSLAASLRKLPPVEGVVYRGIDVAVPTHLYQTGSVVTWQSFSSTTSSPAVAKHFLGGELSEGTFFIIHSKTARFIGPLSAHPEEEESLFLPNCQFRVSGQIDDSVKALLLTSGIDMSSVRAYHLVELLTSPLPRLEDKSISHILSYLSMESLKKHLRVCKRWAGLIMGMLDRKCRLDTAVIEGDLEGVAKAISDGADINAVVGPEHAFQHREWQTPLFVASLKGHVEMVRLLLSDGANFDKADFNDDLPIHIACRRCQPAPVAIDCITRQPLSSLTINGIHHIQVDQVLSTGKWYYEVALVEFEQESAAQIGWCAADALLDAKKGLGSQYAEWAVDFGRLLWLNDTEKPYGDRKWERGDVVGCLLDLDDRTIEFSLNGENKGMFVIGEDTTYFRPCVTVWASAVVQLKLDCVNVQYLPEMSGFQCVDTRPVESIQAQFKDSTSFTLDHLMVVQALHAAKADLNAVNMTTYQSPLQIAIVNHDTDLISWLVHSGALCLNKWSKGKTALHIAAALKGSKDLGVLLGHTHGAIDAQDDNGCTALYYATWNNNRGFALWLLSYGASPNFANKIGRTPLHSATFASSARCLIALLEQPNIFVNVQDRAGVTPLHLAIKSNKRAHVSALLGAKADVNLGDSLQTSPLHLAVRGGLLEVIYMLLENGAQIDARDSSGLTPLHSASQLGYIRIAEILIEEGADACAADDRNQLPLHHAARLGADKAVRFFAERDLALLDSQDRTRRTALHLAAKEGQLDVLKVLLELGANLEVQDSKGDTPVFLALRGDDSDVAAYLIEQGANVKHVNSLDQNLLHVACIQDGEPTTIQLLLDHGVTVSQMSDGSTPLHFQCCHSSYPESIPLLLEHADAGIVNVCDEDGLSALHLATNYDLFSVVSVLVEARADVNLAAKDGDTPLHLACRRQSLPVVARLLQHGADLTVPNSSGLTPVDLAQEAQEGSVLAEFLDKFQAAEDDEERQQLCEAEIWAVPRKSAVDLKHGIASDKDLNRFRATLGASDYIVG